ncbi:unnamed protein product [Penicillium olsonii]|nr:unnamed protein product [Penicillium olsonii]
MQLRIPIVVILSTLNVLACQAAWVSKFPCSSVDYDPLEGPFRIDSIRGTLETSNGSTVLSLSILAIHDIARFDCNDLDLPRLEDSIRFHALGVPFGAITSLSSNCPLPIASTLRPPDGFLFSRFELLYSFNHPHRLQTAVADLSFRTHDGHELDCVVPRITPDIGTPASVVFTYFPAAVMVLVGIASWTKNRNDESAWSTLFGSRVAQSVLSSAWKVILELADYLRYLQFMLLAGSLTLDYPGFYQPVISQTAWSSLLYWTGPVDHGFTYTGVEDGLYVSNRSYGLDYMSQMIGFPTMPDIMIDAFINLVILVFAVFVLSLTLYLAMSQFGRSFHLSLVTWDAGFIFFGMILSFFSLPLLAFLSYELILIGYLPNYRIFLVAVSMAIIVYANFLITRHVNIRREPSDISSPDAALPSSRLARCLQIAHKYLGQYLPASIPLLQGIIIGGVQDWGLSQALLLMGIEIVLLLHLTISLRERIIVSIPAWCGIARLFIVCLTLTFAISKNEVAKEWVGYVLLCFHGIVIIFGFLCVAVWRLTQAISKKARPSSRVQSSGRSDSNSFTLSYQGQHPPSVRSEGSGFPLNRIKKNRHKPGFSTSDEPENPEILGKSSSSSNGPGGSADQFPTPHHPKHYVTDFSAFYRQPRQSSLPPSHKETPSSSGASKISYDGVGENSCSDTSSSEPRDSFDELMEVPIRPEVDYSVRESDAYYRVSANGLVAPTPNPAELAEETHRDRGSMRGWVARTAEMWNPPKKEKGFQVMRPPRPD